MRRLCVFSCSPLVCLLCCCCCRDGPTLHQQPGGKKATLSYSSNNNLAYSFFFFLMKLLSEQDVGRQMFFRWSVLFQLKISARLLRLRWQCALVRSSTFPWSSFLATPHAPGSEEQSPAPSRKSLSLQNERLFAFTPVSSSQILFNQKWESADGAAASFRS